MLILRTILGLGFFCFVAWLLSSDRKRVPWRVIIWGLGLQFLLAALLLNTEWGRGLFEGMAGFVATLIGKAAPGAELVFGPLADPAKMGAVFGPESGFVLAFAGTGLIAIVFFSALMAILYHLGIMQALVWLLARLLSAIMGVSGAEAMAMAANVFVGHTEAPLVVRPYISRMTLSELNAMMTGGFATIAGTVLAVYMGILGEELGPHLISASVLSAPAALLIAKLMRPETEVSETGRHVPFRIERTAANALEAAANGTTTGVKLWLNIVAMLIAFVALVNLIDWPLGAAVEGLSLSKIFGWVFAPVAWAMGVEGWHDSQLMGSLLGIKVTLNELVALSEMQSYLPVGPEGEVFRSPRTAAMAAYALCGFANFGSVGIQLGAIPTLAPERKADVSRLAMRAMLGGAFASWMTATVAGLFL